MKQAEKEGRLRRQEKKKKSYKEHNEESKIKNIKTKKEKNSWRKKRMQLEMMELVSMLSINGKDINAQRQDRWKDASGWWRESEAKCDGKMKGGVTRDLKNESNSQRRRGKKR